MDKGLKMECLDQETTVGTHQTDLPSNSGMETREGRLHKLTEKAQENYENTLKKYTSKLSCLKANVEYEISIFNSEEHKLDSLSLCKRRVETALKKYMEMADEFSKYLSRKNTDNSIEVLAVHRSEYRALEETADIVLREMRRIRDDATDTGSYKTKSNFSRSSFKSTTSSVILRMKAKAEAAKATLEFAAKEAELKKADAETHLKRMNIQADLEFLAKQKEAAAACAEYQAVTEEAGWHYDLESLKDIPKENTMERTKQFVEKQESLRETTVTAPQDTSQTVPKVQYVNGPSTLNQMDQVVNTQNTSFHRTPREFGENYHFQESTAQSADVNEVRSSPDNSNDRTMSELSRFLLKKDLLMSRFSRFNDRPESYAMWKSSFLAITNELLVTAVEEGELLIKWLGPESSRFAQSIRASNLNNPSHGLQKIWQRLEERYGSPELVETSLKTKLTGFPKITFKDRKRFFDLQDILSEILSTKENPVYEKLLSYFDSSVGINPIISKLPPFIQTKWRDRATTYKKRHDIAYPPFSFFVDFVSEQASTLNGPGFVFEMDYSTNSVPRDRGTPVSRPRINVSKTETSNLQESTKIPMKCAIHNTNHSLSDCKFFRSQSIEERRRFLLEKGICFKCLESKDHLSRECTKSISCKECQSTRHNSGMHVGDMPKSKFASKHGGEETDDTAVKSCCTEICKGGFSGKSCAKILPAYVSHRDSPSKRLKIYIMLDEQSNRSLGRKELFDTFGVTERPETYTLTSCSGRTKLVGRRISGLVLESLDGTAKMHIPTVIECDEIPNNREEIPTPEIASYYEHLRSISHELEPLDESVNIILLVGRDLLEAHHVCDQRIGPLHLPYAQRLKLGWVIIGDVCLEHRHVPDVVESYKTYIHSEGRPSLLKPCTNTLSVQELLASQNEVDNFDFDDVKLGDGVFHRTEHDNKPGKSVEDKIFLVKMDQGFHKDERGKWSAPLPFRPNRKRLPNNYTMVLRRANTLDRSLRSNKEKREHFLGFMQDLIDNHHAEIAPELEAGVESWYLPVFGVYHPKKPGKIRCVFDSSAKFNEVSLNQVLMQGPDQNNSLLGVLIRFRKNRVAASADIQQMFYSFSVDSKHRDFLRFLWHKDNDMDKELVAYRMTVHVFGNSPSPAVAIYGLRKCAELADPDVKDFVERNFYVDDGLISVDSTEDMISLLTRTQETLMKEGNIRLHKFASNSDKVMSALPQEDIAQDLKSLDFDSDDVSLQRSLGLYWVLGTDSFTYRISDDTKPFTRRGVLSTLNSVFDPLGFVAPVIILGKFIFRKLISQSFDWDEPLPEPSRKEWETWRNSLIALSHLEIRRMYVPTSISKTTSLELHTFSDASEKAIAAVSYLRIVTPDGNSETGFILGKAKLSPQHGHTIPRLELCAAVLAVEIANTVVENFHTPFDVIKFYTDSKVVLGYIHNQTRRFYIYVENRIDRIRNSSKPEQWNFVPTSLNPADQATRSVLAQDIDSSRWLKGPIEFLANDLRIADESTEDFTAFVDPETDKEIRPSVTVTKTTIGGKALLGLKRFQRFSTWESVIRGVAVLHRFVQFRTQKVALKTVDIVQSMNKAEAFLIKTVQREVYESEIDCLKNNKNLPKNSGIAPLDPFLDEDSMVRVGGRLNKSNLPYQEKNPLLLPGKCHLSKLLVLHLHGQVKHQGRHFTEGAIRTAGYWIMGMKRLVSSIIHHCVQCRRLRGCLTIQKMADLPTDRIETTPPFTNVGVDTFGPWFVVHRRTRGGCANSKRWAILFTCLTTRAIHIEVVEEMSSSAFINALRRLIAIRGNVSIFRSDRGTNFVGATDALQIDSVNVEDGKVRDYMNKSRTVWIFNPPHASHMGGAWERLIGVTRRILDSMFMESKTRLLTHDVLVTFLAEVASIVNHRPIVPVSTDPVNPFVLSPAVLLTQKTSSVPSIDHKVEVDKTDLLRNEWKRVIILSDMFWSRWRREYLNILQSRRKWHTNVPNIKTGDVVLLRDKAVTRNEWPRGLVLRTFEGDDGKVRKTEVRIIKENKPTLYVRPISELVLLVSGST